MQTYKVYFHPQQGFKAVKNGFSWPAFLLNILWAASNNLWRQCIWLALGLMVTGIGQVMAVQLDSAALMLAVACSYTLLLLWPGLQGNRWQAEALQQQGFRLAKRVAASNGESAARQAAEHLERENRRKRQSRQASAAG